MKKIIIIGVVTILLIGAVVFLAYSRSGIYEEPNAFGSWGTKITFNYEDGTADIITEPLKLFSANGKIVESITYTLLSKASSNNIDQYEIDATGITIMWSIGDYGVYQDSQGAGPHKDQFVVYTFDITDQWDTIININRATSSLNLGLFSPGEYTFKLRPVGDLKYKGAGQTTWETAQLPVGVSITIEIIDDTTFTVDFSDDVDYIEQDDPNAEYWTWDLTEGNNLVTFTEAQLDACPSHSTEDVFASIDHDCILNTVFESDTWYNFWFCQAGMSPDSRGGTLQIIQADIVYHAMVNEDCVLSIAMP